MDRDANVPACTVPLSFWYSYCVFFFCKPFPLFSSHSPLLFLRAFGHATEKKEKIREEGSPPLLSPTFSAHVHSAATAPQL
ncbi:hypothetical protein TRSC58_07685 [Trypanosoma rangeli SC58]|uniref:Uncharacterized protein n=1 Tax=Trypanosoma rangeli SC58 TaxID=429131 RepID=A0A061IRI2_TRYRA|nr:hypothetical protein TRSC58_07685 [Trypanosoma rangeli SC58]